MSRPISTIVVLIFLLLLVPSRILGPAPVAAPPAPSPLITPTIISDGVFPSIDGDLVAFMQDLNISYFFLSGKKVTTLLPPFGSIGILAPSVSGNIIAMLGVYDFIPPTGSGEVFYYNVTSKSFARTGVPVGVYGDVFTGPNVNGRIIAWGGSSGIVYYNITNNRLTMTGAPGNFPEVYGNLIVFQTEEYKIGRDLNGDGDMIDDIIFYYNMRTGTLVNTGVTGSDPSIHGDMIAFSTSEAQLNADLNGDGNKLDWIIRYYNIPTGTVVNTVQKGVRPSVSDSIISYDFDENITGVDLNKDGDMLDSWVRYYNLRTGRPILGTILISGGFTHAYQDKIVFWTDENQTRTDINSNGVIGDLLVRVIATTIIGDINGNGAVEILDASQIAFAFGTVLGDPKYNPFADINGDGRVDILDASAMGANFGRTLAGP